MNLTNIYMEALESNGLFENYAHKTRFKELMDCYSQYPFFNKGLCKCMYLSSWDDEHFIVMVEMLNSMAIGREEDTEEMRIEGNMRAEDYKEEHEDGEAFVYNLSSSFLNGTRFGLEGLEKLPEHFQYLVRRAVAAEDVIESVVV